jgi:hypothetical protein
MELISDKKAKMCGGSIIGFGKYFYTGKSTAGQWFKIDFSQRKQNTSIYAISGFKKETEPLATLGKYKNSQGCMYNNPIADVEMALLKAFLQRPWDEMKNR